MGAEKKEDPLIQLSVHYENVVKGTTETLTNICNITRIDGKQIGERNVELDQQYNRVIASDAMEEAEKLAKNGKLKDDPIIAEHRLLWQCTRRVPARECGSSLKLSVPLDILAECHEFELFC